MAKKKQTVKVSEPMLARYCEIAEQLKKLKEEQDSLKDVFKCVGSVETANYKMSVSPGSSRQMAGIEDVAKAFKVTEAKLDKLGLIRHSKYETVRVTPKKDKK